MKPEPRYAWTGDSIVAEDMVQDDPVALKGVPDRWHLYRVMT